MIKVRLEGKKNSQLGKAGIKTQLKCLAKNLDDRQQSNLKYGSKNTLAQSITVKTEGKY